MKRVIILGNGKSRDLYKSEDYNSETDYVIGCNLPREGTHHDFVASVDAKAVMLAWRKGSNYFRRLAEEKFKLVIGPRCAHGLTKTKSEAGGKHTLLEWLTANEHIYKKVQVYPDAKEIGQRYFSAGHLAFVFALDEWGKEIDEYHFYGFDSFCTGVQVSYTDKLRNDKITELKERERKKYNINEPNNTVGAWYWLWEKIFEYRKEDYKKVYIHGFENDTIPDAFFLRGIEVINHET